jgi:pimeloyl-ACP methyl ester carboxylesterase
MDLFEAKHVEAAGATLSVRWQGTGPPLLFLHGFPQTSLMGVILPKAWRTASRLFARICAATEGAVVRCRRRTTHRTRNVPWPPT